jgi:nascent polypeptide-associated complex subunit alpha
MLPGINPKKMQSMMKQMGISQEEIDASKVIIETESKNIIIENPAVIKINMQGQESFQITGEVSEQEISDSNTYKNDIQTIIEKTKCSKEEAEKSLKESNNDLTEAILNLS